MREHSILIVRFLTSKTMKYICRPLARASSRGFSLLSVLVSMAVGALVLLGVMRMSDFSLKIGRNLSSTVEVESAMTEALQALASKNVCRCNLAPSTSPGPMTFSESAVATTKFSYSTIGFFTDSTGACSSLNRNVLAVGGGGSNFKVLSIELLDLSKLSEIRYQGKLHVRFSKGKTELLRTLPVSLETATASGIVTLQSCTGSASNGDGGVEDEIKTLKAQLGLLNGTPKTFGGGSSASSYVVPTGKVFSLYAGGPLGNTTSAPAPILYPAGSILTVPAYGQNARGILIDAEGIAPMEPLSLTAHMDGAHATYVVPSGKILNLRRLEMRSEIAAAGRCNVNGVEHRFKASQFDDYSLPMSQTFGPGQTVDVSVTNIGTGPTLYDCSVFGNLIQQ